MLAAKADLIAGLSLGLNPLLLAWKMSGSSKMTCSTPLKYFGRCFSNTWIDSLKCSVIPTTAKCLSKFWNRSNIKGKLI